MKIGLAWLLLLSVTLSVAGCGSTPPSTDSPVNPAASPITSKDSPAPVQAGKSSDAFSQALRLLIMVDGEIGWAASPETAYRTTDGGSHWLEARFGGDPDEGVPIGAFATDADHLWLAEQAGPGSKSITMWRTVDGGKTWFSVVLEVPIRVSRVDMDFVSEHDGWLLASTGLALGQMQKALYHTTDGGKSWQLVTCGCPDQDASSPKWLLGGMYTTGMAFRSGSAGWVTGTYHGDDTIPVYRTEDGGRTWKVQDLAVPQDIRQAPYGNGMDPIFFGEKRESGVLPIGFRTGDRYTIAFLGTKDGGQTWESIGEVEAPLCNSGSPEECQVVATDPNHFWVLQRGSTLLRTSDAGKTWRQVALKLHVATMSFGSATDALGLARSDQGQVMVHSSDGGDTWTEIQPIVSPLK